MSCKDGSDRDIGVQGEHAKHHLCPAGSELGLSHTHDAAVPARGPLARDMQRTFHHVV